MNEKDKKISYKAIYITVLTIFMIFYLIAMSVFTGIQGRNNRVSFNKACKELINKIEKDLLETVQGTDNENLAQKINNYVGEFYPEAYVKVGIYDNSKNEWIVKSENHLNKYTYRYSRECRKEFEIPYLPRNIRQISDHTLSSFIKEVESAVVRSENDFILLYAIYLPWHTTIKQLIYIYIFSFILVMVLVSILSRQLWKLYEN